MNRRPTSDILSLLSPVHRSKVDRTRRRLEAFRQRDEKCLATSSFQTQSIPMLHLLSLFAPRIPIVFLDTGYLFPETLEFRDHVSESLGLQVLNLRPERSKTEQLGRDGRLLFASDPDRCCHYNKIEPLQPLLAHYDIWISGIRRDQSAHRRKVAEESRDVSGIRRYHPMLDWNQSDIEFYIDLFSLPRHPLDSMGYTSIGCIPCTAPACFHESNREGRWYGTRKTECGLHARSGHVKEKAQ